MKKSAFFSLALLCALPFFFAFENASPPGISPKGIIVRVAPVEHEKAFVLRLANLERQPLRINIFDADGHVFYSEKVVDHNGYRKLISLRNLDSGEYKIMIMHPKESRTGTIKVSPKAVEIDWEETDWAG